VLGAAPAYDFMFAVSAVVHEALVYVAAVQRLFASWLAPPAGFLLQLVVDLSGGDAVARGVFELGDIYRSLFCGLRCWKTKLSRWVTWETEI